MKNSESSNNFWETSRRPSKTWSNKKLFGYSTNWQKQKQNRKKRRKKKIPLTPPPKKWNNWNVDLLFTVPPSSFLEAHLNKHSTSLGANQARWYNNKADPAEEDAFAPRVWAQCCWAWGYIPLDPSIPGAAALRMPTCRAYPSSTKLGDAGAGCKSRHAHSCVCTCTFPLHSNHNEGREICFSWLQVCDSIPERVGACQSPSASVCKQAQQMVNMDLASWWKPWTDASG